MSKALGFIDLLLSVVQCSVTEYSMMRWDLWYSLVVQNTPWWTEAPEFIDLLLSVPICNITEYIMMSLDPGVYQSIAVCGEVWRYRMHHDELIPWGYRSLFFCNEV